GTDAGARRLGEIGIGTNPNIDRPTGSTLFDEKILGTVHLALGRSYVESGGLNHSDIHWDLICDLRQEGTVTVDGEPFLAGGRLLCLAACGLYLAVQPRSMHITLPVAPLAASDASHETSSATSCGSSRRLTATCSRKTRCSTSLSAMPRVRA